MDFQSKFLQYQKNIYPMMVEQLARDLGVTVKSINKLGIGFCPGSQSWVWAERDEQGEIVGLGHYYPDGKKRMEEGSKRGLIYECAGSIKKENVYPRSKFIRTYNASVDCPLCGKRDWCLISDEDISSPSAVICGRTEEGSKRYIENAGYLHILKGNSRTHKRCALLSPSDKPYLVVEGFTDVLAAMDMDYVAIGRPSAEGRTNWLASLLKGQDVIVVGENDEAGRRGMQKAFQVLKAVCSSVRKVLPPAQHKDLRAWYPTADEFELWVSEKADKADVEKILDSDDPRFLAKKWLEENFQSGKYQLLHYCNEDWYNYDDFHYQKIVDKSLDSRLTAFLDNYEFVQQRGQAKECKPFRITRRFNDDVKFNLRTLCYLDIPDNAYKPFRINKGEFIDVKKAIAFSNGIYQIDSGRFETASPDIFVISTLPYEYQPIAKYDQWLYFIRDVFNGDEESINLLQEWFGYNLVASNHMESMMFLFGGRAAGKSTTIDVLQAVLGPQSYAAIDTIDFISMFGFESLIAKYALIVSEDRPVRRTDKEKVLHKIKQITGQDTIIIRRKYKSAINIKPFFKITYVSNELPDFSDESGSFMRRLNLLHYPNCYEDSPDRTLKDRLVTEAPGIAIWAIEGLKRLIENGKFTLPDSSKEHLADVQILTNPLRTMLLEHCTVRDGDYTPITTLFDLHQKVYEENQIEPMSRILFGIKLKTVIPATVKRSRRRVAGELVYVYDNIHITPSAYRRYLDRPV